MRTDIQALRALAVVAVFVYHMRPNYLTGGFVGVDVFFVLSGFLISTHLISELQATGKINFSQFWSRRIRRLLPASLTVLSATGIAVGLFAPQALQERFYRDISAATLYVANWIFAFDSVDYLASDYSPSVVQHFWSLGVEEQLYLLWPLLLATTWGLFSARWSGPGALRAFLVAVFITSLTYSALLVFDDNPIAYFSTLSRAWEFSAGALLALGMQGSGVMDSRNVGVRKFASWLGWLSLVAFMFFFESESGFPGLNALVPVASTLLIIWAKDPVGKFGLSRLLALKPIQLAGDASYSIYLWHWPILVFVGFFMADIPWPVLGLIFATTVALALLSLKFIENPFRSGRLKARLRPALVFSGTAIAMTIILVSTQVAAAVVSNEIARQSAASAILEAELEKQIDASLQGSSVNGASVRVWDEVSCMGPAFLTEKECANFSWKTYVPTIGTREDTAHDVEPLERIGSKKGCLAWGADYGLIECVYGELGGRKTLLVGDSHAYHWLPSFSRVAAEQGLELHFLARAGCPVNSVAREAAGDHVRGCFSWIKEFNTWVKENQDIDLVIVANFVGSRFVGAGEYGAKQPAAIDGYKKAWKPILATGAEVVILKDTPFIAADAWNCMVNNPQKNKKCDVSRKVIEKEYDNSAAAGKALGLRVLDMTDYFCTAKLCPMVVGGVRVYRDSNHMSGTYSLLMKPYLSKELFG